MNRLVGAAGAALGAVGVAAGAFGAHALRDHVTTERYATWTTAADYHLWHAVLLVVLAVILARRPSTAARVAAGALVVGVLVFSGSLYALVLTDTPALGAVTPVGGVALIVGWVALAVAALQSPA